MTTAASPLPLPSQANRRAFGSYVSVDMITHCHEWFGDDLFGGCNPVRVAWEWTFGPLPSGCRLAHRCGSPWCVNAAHLVVRRYA